MHTLTLNCSRKHIALAQRIMDDIIDLELEDRTHHGKD